MDRRRSRDPWKARGSRPNSTGQVERFAFFDGQVVVVGADDDEVGGFHHLEMALKAVLYHFGLAAVVPAGGDGER